MGPKRPNEADSNKWVLGEYFRTDWSEILESTGDLLVVLNMAALYEHPSRKHFSLAPREGESLTDQIESRLHKTKQFNRKVELNQQLRSLKFEVESLSST
jgi:hypothetical protein